MRLVMLTKGEVDRIADQITETARADNGEDLWERVRAILRTWTGN